LLPLPSLWHIRLSPLAFCSVTVAICQWSHNHCANCNTRHLVFFTQTVTSLWSIFHNSGSLRNGCVSIGISQPSQCDMPRDKSELKAESYQNPPNLENLFLRFYVDGCATIALRQVIFKRKKGLATISLGLIYHSLVVSHTPCCDTVPLGFVHCKRIAQAQAPLTLRHFQMA
jgi:hypothetical protein